MENSHEQDKNIVSSVPIEALVENPKNFFQDTDDTAFNELCNSINEVGLLSPLVVVPQEDKFRIVAGHRRRKALIKLGHEEAPVIIKNVDNITEEMAIMDSNYHTRQLSPTEIAMCVRKYKELITEKRKMPNDDTYKGKRTRDIISEKLDISSSNVERMDKLNDLIPEFKKLVDEGNLSMMAGFNLATLPKEVQEQFKIAYGNEIYQMTTMDIKEIIDKKEDLIKKHEQENKEMHSVVLRMENEIRVKEKERDTILGDEKKRYTLKEEIKELEIKKQNLLMDVQDRKIALDYLLEKKEKAKSYGAELMRPLNKPMKTLWDIQATVKFAADRVENDPHGKIIENLDRHIILLQEYIEILSSAKKRLNQNNHNKEEDNICVVS